MKTRDEAQKVMQDYSDNKKFADMNLLMCLIRLKDAKLLNIDNVHSTLNHPNYAKLASAIESLHRHTANFATQERFDNIIKFSKDPASIACILHDLAAANLLDQKNESAVFTLKDQESKLVTLDQLLRELLQVGCLTQDNFQKAVANYEKIPSLDDYRAYKECTNGLFPDLAVANKAGPR